MLKASLLLRTATSGVKKEEKYMFNIVYKIFTLTNNV